MSKIDIVVGPEGNTEIVEAVPFLPGLLVHKPPGVKKSADVYNITHQLSGLAVLVDVPEYLLELTRMILGRVIWIRSAREIFDSSTYYEVVMNAVRVIDIRKESKKQEEKIASDIRGKRQYGSGAMWGYRRDITSKSALIEAKFTHSANYYAKLADIDFLKKQAYAQGKLPAYLVSIDKREEVAILPADTFEPEVLADIPVWDLRDKVAIPIDVGVCQTTSAGGRIVAHCKTGSYVIVGYEEFVNIAKGKE